MVPENEVEYNNLYHVRNSLKLGIGSTKSGQNIMEFKNIGNFVTNMKFLYFRVIGRFDCGVVNMATLVWKR
jgi:hypothetical protein